MVANYAGILAGILFLVSLFRADFATRRATRLPLIVTCTVMSIVIATLGAEGILLKQSEAWNLVYGLVPISLAIALVSRPRTAAAESSNSR
jgi:hypothetical protein